MIEQLAPAWGGLLIFPEQRFYGKSLPFGNASLASAKNLAYLTTSQVLEDYVELLAHLKATLPEASACPVVAFGGSYGGTLAALLRVSYPASIAGALASSSELGYYDVERWTEYGVTEFTFEDVAVADYTQAQPGCFEAIQGAIDEIESTAEQEIVDAFHACDARSLRPLKSSLFVYALENLPQLDYPYAIGTMPAKPVSFACAQLLNASGNLRQRGRALVQAAGAIVGLAIGQHGTSCIPYQGPGGPGNTPGDGPGPGAWGWQSCTETLHRFSARALRRYTFDLEASAAQCGALYGRGVRPDTAALARRFGGFALADGSAGVSRLIWSHGTLDPWHGWFRNMAKPSVGSDVHHFLMEGAAHHLDLRSPRAEDPPAVANARQREAEIIHRWILEAAAKYVVVV